MSESLSQAKNQLNDYFQKLEKKQKIVLFSSTIFTILALTGIIYYFTRPEYIEIYRNLEPKQAGEIMDALGDNNISAKFGQTSGTILVPKSDEKKAQVVVATQGLPTTKFSFDDAFSGNSFMMTSEERSKRYIYALQNYLGSIIEEIRGVKRADVALVVPEKTGFVLNSNESPAKASVKLDLEGNAALDNNSINGIAILVSNAVEGLAPENVTIHDSYGRVLNQKKDETSPSYSANTNLSLQQSVKDELERSITNFLSNVYGHGNVVVMANVKLDFDSEVTEIKEFAPPIADETTGIPRSLQELSQNVINGGAGGAPGIDTNTEDIPEYVEGDQNYSNYSEASKTINYEINELYKKIVKAEGQVKDVTVAVFLNSNSLADGDLTAEQKADLINIISAAAGLDTKVVQVGVQQFNDSFANMEDDIPTGTKTPIMPLWAIGLIFATVLGATFIVFSRRRKSKEDEIIETIDKMIIPEPIEELDLQLAGSQVKQQIEKLVNKKPEAVAQLLKNWLNED